MTCSPWHACCPQAGDLTVLHAWQEVLAAALLPRARAAQVCSLQHVLA